MAKGREVGSMGEPELLEWVKAVGARSIMTPMALDRLRVLIQERDAYKSIAEEAVAIVEGRPPRNPLEAVEAWNRALAKFRT